MRASRRTPLVLAGIALVAAACQTDLPTLEAPDTARASSWCSNIPSYIHISPGGLLMPAGQSTSVQAWLYDTTHCWMSNEPLYWHSSNPWVADVWGTVWGAHVYAIAPGGAWITARTWNWSASASILVSVYQPVLSGIGVSPGSQNVYVGGSATFSATGYDQYGHACVNWCGASAPGWSVDHSNIASINGGGTATGLAVGSTTVRASSGSVSGSAGFHVIGDTPPGPADPPGPCYPNGCIQVP